MPTRPSATCGIMLSIMITGLFLTTAKAAETMDLNIVTIEKATPPETLILKQPAHTVNFPLSEADHTLIKKMEAKLYALHGVGLAATQIGVAKKIAVVYIPEEAALLRENACIKPMHVLINPEYWPVGTTTKETDYEGCYSVATISGKVPRFHTIRVKYQTKKGEFIDTVVSGFYARVLQHEIDHLNGILITDRLTPDCLQGDHASMLKARRQELPEEKRHYLDTWAKQKGINVQEAE